MLKTAAETVGNKDCNCQLLYFTSSSLSADDTTIFFISDRSGSPNIHVKNLITGSEKMLTDNKSGYQKSYVYFDGDPLIGLGKASISLDTLNKIVYYIQDNQIKCVNENGEIKTLADVPSGEVTAFTHVSADGKLLCVPTTDARALEYDTIVNNTVPYNIDERVQRENLCSYLNVIDTATGEIVLREPVPKSWITHVQFSPTDNSKILYNHEWPGDCGIRRMWLFDGENHIALRTENDERRRDDWTCHEMWSTNGQSIIYHGSYHGGQSYIGKIEMNDLSITEIAIQENYKKYGHFTISPTGMLVSDGYYEENDTSNWSEYISIQQIDWTRKKINWIPLCKHNSSWRSQDAHPHPIYNHAGDKIYYTSDSLNDTLKIYAVNCDENTST